jgi:hypothetical protein
MRSHTAERVRVVLRKHWAPAGSAAVVLHSTPRPITTTAFTAATRGGRSNNRVVVLACRPFFWLGSGLHQLPCRKLPKYHGRISS